MWPGGHGFCGGPLAEMQEQTFRYSGNRVLWSSDFAIQHPILECCLAGRFLTDELMKVQVVNEVNKDFVIEALRSISELITYGDQHDVAYFEFFMEKQVMGEFVRVLRISRTVIVSLQLLQTMSIVIQNLKNENSIYYMFSNEHINHLITYSFDFRNEELLSYYISFLRAISGKLNKNTISLLVKTHNEVVVSFPLYVEAIHFAFHEESMIRTAVRALTLNVYHVILMPIISQIWSKFFREQCINLDKLVNASKCQDPDTTGSIISSVDEIEDNLYYFSDVISAGIPDLGRLITDLMLKDTGIGTATSLYLLCCILHIVKIKDLANIVAAVLLCDIETFVPRSEAKVNGFMVNHDMPHENQDSENGGFISDSDGQSLRVLVPNISSSLNSHPEDGIPQPDHGSTYSTLRAALLSYITTGDDVQVSGSLSMLATLLQTKGYISELEESMLDALGILPQRKQQKKLLLGMGKANFLNLDSQESMDVKCQVLSICGVKHWSSRVRPDQKPPKIKKINSGPELALFFLKEKHSFRSLKEDPFTDEIHALCMKNQSSSLALEVSKADLATASAGGSRDESSEKIGEDGEVYMGDTMLSTKDVCSTQCSSSESKEFLSSGVPDCNLQVVPIEQLFSWPIEEAQPLDVQASPISMWNLPDQRIQSDQEQYGLLCVCKEVTVSPRRQRLQSPSKFSESHCLLLYPFVILVVARLFRSNISAETLWDGGWLLRQLHPYSEADFNSHHLKLLKDSFHSCTSCILDETKGTWPDLLIMVLCDEWRKCKRTIEASSPRKDPKSMLLPSHKSLSEELARGESSFAAGERLFEIVKVFVLLHQLHIFSVGKVLPDQPPIHPTVDVMETSRAKRAGIDSLGPKPSIELSLVYEGTYCQRSKPALLRSVVDAVPCRIAFERGKERHFHFLANSVGTSGWLILADELPVRPSFGVVCVVAPLGGCNPRIDEKHMRWLHLRIRPSSFPYIDAAEHTFNAKVKSKALVDGRWTLAFRDEDSCKAAFSMIIEELKLLSDEVERRIKPMLDIERTIDTSTK
ncbi:hypothetical protein RND71_009655 [Anisodus tanguticus]|uniref:FPL domain-containing protein n=1 Tax=Anisodus tanguticus TaxID=243964 RepID=A0AAE1VS19_9SOLA|nr:hypothetical protein RND71_009655 [Anisodus tanguticus]